MDGENNGNPYEQMDDLGGKTTPSFGNTHIVGNYQLSDTPVLECSWHVYIMYLYNAFFNNKRFRILLMNTNAKYKKVAWQSTNNLLLIVAKLRDRIWFWIRKNNCL